MGIFDKNKKADFSDVQGGSSTTDPLRSSAPAAPAARTYTVVKGDSLSRIAKHLYGKASDWHKIYEANKDTIKDPDLIYPGQTLTIPE
jgi:nucleoid-associated protein YgaU